jgi:hypothetical protein
MIGAAHAVTAAAFTKRRRSMPGVDSLEPMSSLVNASSWLEKVSLL